MLVSVFLRAESFRKKKKKQAWNYLDSFNSLYCWKKLSSLWTSQKTYLKNLLVIFADFQQSKTPFGETPWLMRRHATPLVTLFFWYHHVTYRTPCHVSGHPWSTTSATNLRKRFVPSSVFYLALLPAGLKPSLGAGSSTSKLAGFHADLRNIVQNRLFVWITTIHKRGTVVGSV